LQLANAHLSKALHNNTKTGLPKQRNSTYSMSELSPNKLSSSNLSECTGETDVSTEIVSFGAVHVREYERVPGIDPEIRFGVSLSIGWDFVERQAVDIDTYESLHVPKGMMRINYDRRTKLLEDYGYSGQELYAAQRETEKIRKSSKKQSKLSGKTKSTVRGIGGKLRRALSVSW
jgi:hypothetical protein